MNYWRYVRKRQEPDKAINKRISQVIKFMSIALKVFISNRFILILTFLKLLLEITFGSTSVIPHREF